MCQLLGINSKHPIDMRFSMSGFCQRGGVTDDHIDGVGVAYFEPTGLRLYCDDRSATQSPLLNLLAQWQIKAANTLVHIRKSDDHLLMNAHPFVREVWGEPWVFSHNGKMTIKDALADDPIHQADSRYYQPIGDTDSEVAFCYLLNRLKERFTDRPSDTELYDFLCQQCRFLAQYGLFNCLLCNGRWYLAYANTLLFYVTRRAPFAKATLVDTEVCMDFAQTNADDDVVTVLATTPLTGDEQWQQLAVNECAVFRAGEQVYRDTPPEPTYLSIEEGLKIAKEA